MMNQGSESIAGLGSNSAENYQVAGAGQGHTSLYVSSTSGHHSFPQSSGPANAALNFYRQDHAPTPTETGVSSNSGYHYDPHKGTTVSGDALNSATPDYASYASYSGSTDPYNYSNMGYQSYYAYQQPANDSSSQLVGANQNSGAPYQSYSSFQNTASYAAPTSYSGTYYNTGDHQTEAGYQNSSYVHQSNVWADGSTGSYTPHQYSSYTSSDTNSTQATSTAAANSLHYQQHYSHWPYYYGPSAPTASFAPGTENTLATTASTYTSSVQGASGGYPYPSNQPPPPGTTSWSRDSGTAGLASLQEKGNVATYNPTGGWEVGPPGTQNYQINQAAQNYQINQAAPHFQKPLDSNTLPHEKCEDQQKPMYSQGPTSQLSTSQAPENFPSPLQTAAVMDARRVSKMQIPTNPRIASTLALGMSKVDKESPTANASLKPAYISVSAPQLSNKLSSHDDADSIMKGTFPPALRAYVERTFARCKDDSQRAANQNIMKEMLTKASADGTLFTRNWDTEPLFPLPNCSLGAADQNNIQNSVAVSTLPKYKRSPNRRIKSRWEPIAEEKLAEKLAPVTHDTPIKGAERMAGSKIYESYNGWNGMKFLSSQQQTPLSKVAQRPVKKPRFADTTNATENGDASSDSDKEQSLTKYYSSAVALANSPEEKKRREHRYKRFEKGQENQAEIKLYRPKVAGTENIYTRRASALQIAKNYEDVCSRAVEDIDWDALTVKGTCQEVEKRYLRLTSAPDPATVRPEEVLEKALVMVQTSQKNYLFKCDQLKSIRQDLTVQRIQNELTVKVYETHARLALEAGDLPEYNQCQSQLQRLYAEGIKGCHMEFAAYNLLCVILHSNNNRDLLSARRRLSDEAKRDEAVKHALAVRSAVSSGNYILFFRLYKAAPNLNTCLMDLAVEKMRFEAIKCISKSYRPTVPVTYIARNLGFSRAVQSEDSGNKDTNGLEECEEWLRAHGAILIVENNGELQMDTKVSSSSLYMPEPEDAVAHGDASLAVDDFLTRLPSSS